MTIRRKDTAPPQPKKLSPAEVRAKVVEEILNTERDYVRHLGDIVEVRGGVEKGEEGEGEGSEGRGGVKGEEEWGGEGTRGEEEREGRTRNVVS